MLYANYISCSVFRLTAMQTNIDLCNSDRDRYRFQLINATVNQGNGQRCAVQIIQMSNGEKNPTATIGKSRVGLIEPARQPDKVRWWKEKSRTRPLTTFGHANHKAFLKTAAFTGCTILFIDDTFAIVFAFAQSRKIIISAAEEWLRKEMIKRKTVRLVHLK